MYSLFHQFNSEDASEYERFYNKFIEDAKLNRDLLRIVQILGKIADEGALERRFRPEGKMIHYVDMYLIFKNLKNF